jgi:hypothetical protein
MLRIRPIRSRQRDPFDHCLCDQETVEGIFVDGR